MKKVLVLIITLLVLTLLSCQSDKGFEIKRDGDVTTFDLSQLDGEIEESIMLNEGDSLAVNISYISGKARIELGDIYLGNIREDRTFTLNISESREYKVRIKGDKFKAKVSMRRR